MSPNAGEGGELRGSQSMSTAVHRNPNKLWRSNSIINLCMYEKDGKCDIDYHAVGYLVVVSDRVVFVA
jgi:hypothetical protein